MTLNFVEPVSGQRQPWWSTSPRYVPPNFTKTGDLTCRKYFGKTVANWAFGERAVPPPAPIWRFPWRFWHAGQHLSAVGCPFVANGSGRHASLTEVVFALIFVVRLVPWVHLRVLRCLFTPQGSGPSSFRKLN